MRTVSPPPFAKYSDSITMSWDIKLFDTRFVLVNTKGSFFADGESEMVQEIINKDFWKPGTPILFDHRELDFSKTDFNGMVRAGDIHKKLDEKIGQARSALVVTPGQGFASLRQFLCMTEGDISADIKLFTDFEAARTWLLESE